MGNILRFEKDFPGAKVIRLERNYRSTGHILAAASRPDRPQRGPARQDAVHRPAEDGEKVGVVSGLGRRGGARRSARRSSSCSGKGISLDEMAILVRASFQMREFEDRFITLGLPYRVIGGPRFYERRRSATRSPICAPS